MMRPTQKSGRSRGKSNRGGKSQGHSPNRVYESAGPEGKVRGTPQQIIEKYQALARDAHVSGDRVGAENFLQHSEHYSRILVAAQESAQERQSQHNNNQNQNAQNQNHGGNGGQHQNGGNNQATQNQNDGQNAQSEGQNTQPASQEQHSGKRDEQKDAPRRTAPKRAVSGHDEQPPADGLAAIDAAQQDQPDLVETPENKPKPRAPRARRPRTPKVVSDDAVAKPSPDTPADAAE